jgi:hypothetical protein
MTYPALLDSKGVVMKCELLVVVFCAWLLLVLTGIAVAEEGSERGTTCRTQVWYGAQELQPWFKLASSPSVAVGRMTHLRRLTDAICDASSETGIDPLLALAVAFRESSLNPEVGLGKRNGKRGERGYFQVLPGSPAERFAPGKCFQHEPSCNATAALRYMKHLQGVEVCGSDDPWVWLAAYGAGRCPPAEESREWPGMKQARRLFCDLDKSCGDVWPE